MRIGRFHLATALVTMIAAGCLLWINMRTVFGMGEVPSAIHALYNETTTINVDHEPLEAAVDACVGRFPYTRIVYAEGEILVTCSLKNIKRSDALTAVTSKCGLAWGTFADALFVGKATDINKFRSMLENVNDAMLRKRLMRRVTFCSPDGFPPGEASTYLSSISGIRIVSQLPEGQLDLRFSINFQEMELKNALRWLALNYDADVVEKDGTIAFVPKHAIAPVVNLNQAPRESDWTTPTIYRKGWPFAYLENEELYFEDASLTPLRPKALALDILINGLLLIAITVACELLVRSSHSARKLRDHAPATPPSA